MRTYAIGDIHGHLADLKAAHARIAADRARTGDAEAPVIHLGDLVDRGPDAAGVIGWLLAGMARGEPWQVLKGNHDRCFQNFLERGELYDPRATPSWLERPMGGAQTLMSYGVDPSRAPEAVHEQALRRVPAEHQAFLAARPLGLRRGEAFFVHAGIRPGVPLEGQVEDDLVWIREPFLSDRREHGVLVVHGHTALRQARHFGNRVNIDSSMAFGGHLTVIALEGREVWELTERGRQPLRP